MPPKHSKPKLTARVIDCLEQVCAYANIGMELSDLETPLDAESEAQTDAGVTYLRKLIEWYDVKHRSRTGHWRWCAAPRGHEGPGLRPEPPLENRPPEPPVDPEYEAMVQEITQEAQAK